MHVPQLPEVGLQTTDVKAMGTSWGDAACLKFEASGWLPSVGYAGGLASRQSSGRGVPPNTHTLCHWKWLRHPARPLALPRRMQISQGFFSIVSVWSGRVSQVPQDISEDTRNLCQGQLLVAKCSESCRASFGHALCWLVFFLSKTVAVPFIWCWPQI